MTVNIANTRMSAHTRPINLFATEFSIKFDKLIKLKIKHAHITQQIIIFIILWTQIQLFQPCNIL